MSVSVKQVIVVRMDLNMRKGKIAAQVAHASLKVFLDRKVKITGPEGQDLPVQGLQITAPVGPDTGSERRHEPATIVGWGPLLTIPLTEAMAAWVDGAFTKIVLGVESEADLLRVHEAATEAGIPTALIQDMGHTEFHGIPTYTTCALGPDVPEKIDAITGPQGLIKCRLL